MTNIATRLPLSQIDQEGRKEDAQAVTANVPPAM
jgi:hypothetical protein